MVETIFLGEHGVAAWLADKKKEKEKPADTYKLQ